MFPVCSDMYYETGVRYWLNVQRKRYGLRPLREANCADAVVEQLKQLVRNGQTMHVDSKDATRMHKVRRRTAVLATAALLFMGLPIAAETLASGAQASVCTISGDASAPAEVKLANSTAATATTASFSPPAGVDVVVQVSIVYDRNTPNGPTVTVKDSHNTAFTAGPSAYNAAAEGTYTFSHYYATAPGATTISATRAGQTGAALYDVRTRVLTGAASSQAGAASASDHAKSGTSLTKAITPTALGSDVEVSIAAGTTGALTAAGGLTTGSSWHDVNDGSSTAGGHKITTALTSETLGWTVPSATFWSLAELEVLPATTCAAGAPAVTTTAATGVGNTTATLNGTVNPEGASTTYQFDYGPTTSYGTSVPAPAGSAGSGSSAVHESANLTGLTPGAVYHYRIKATNATGTTLGSDQQFTASTARLLTWSPPACGGADGLTCTDLNLTNTGSNQTPSLASNVDYRIHLPTTGPLTGGLQIRGGHNVQIIGGEIDLTYPCSDSSSACHGINISKSTSGEVYLEGVWIHNAHTIPTSCSTSGMPCSTGDGIDEDLLGSSTPSNLVLQNVRIDGVSGCSGGSDHADVFQPYQAGGSTISIDHMTGTSNCQGLQIDPDLASANPPSYTIKNTNMDVLSNPYSGNSNRYMWWLTGGSSGCSSGNVSLSSDYAQQPNGTLGINSVWPDTDQPTVCKSTWSSPTLSFPNSPQITGTLNVGLPPGGDYVSGGGAGAGTGYVSPGYQ